MNNHELGNLFDELFDKAKARDEFEYVCTLLRIRGLESAGWDTLEETVQLYDDITSLLDAPLRGATRVRLALLLYAHLTEVDALYLILINMIHVADGERYSFDPFHHLYRPRNRARVDQIPPSAKSKINHIITTAESKDEQRLADALRLFFNDSVRNAFFHSDYTIYDNEFRSRGASFLQPNGTISSAMSLQQLESIISQGVFFYQAFMETFVKRLKSYTHDVRSTGRIHGNEDRIPLIITADENGLTGFRSI